jgi:DNA-binding transcriptional MocR family regulator
LIEQKHGVLFQPGRLFSHEAKPKAELTNFLRLAIAVVDCGKIKEGYTRLKRAFEEYKNITTE